MPENIRLQPMQADGKTVPIDDPMSPGPIMPDAPFALLSGELHRAVSSGEVSPASLLCTAVLPVMCLSILEAIEGPQAGATLKSLRRLGLAPPARGHGDDANRAWQTDPLQRGVALDAAARQGRMESALDQLAAGIKQYAFTPELESHLARWTEVFTYPEQLLTKIHSAMRADRDDEANDLLKNARLLAPVFPALGHKAEEAAKHVALRLRDRVDEARLKSFVPKANELEAVDALLESADTEWAINLVGPGGIGKTMLARYLTLNHLPQKGVTCARIDFDHLDPDYPEKNPALLIRQFLAEIARSFATSDQDVKAGYFLVESVRQAPFEIPPSELDKLADQFADFVREVGAKRIVLLLDTCEELARPRIGSQPRAAVIHTLALLQALHDKLPSLRAIFLGRRPVQAREHAGFPPVIPLRGFTRGEASEFLRTRTGGAMTSETVQRTLDNTRSPSQATTWMPFDLNLMADWFSSEPETFLASSDQADLKCKYVDSRIVARMRTSNARRLLAVATALGTFDVRMLTELSGGTELEIDIFLSQEWVCAQAAVFRIEASLRERLHAYFENRPDLKRPGLSRTALSWLQAHCEDRITSIALFEAVTQLLQEDDVGWSGVEDRAGWQLQWWRELERAFEQDPTRGYEVVTIILGAAKSANGALPEALQVRMAKARASWAPEGLPPAGRRELWKEVEEKSTDPSDKLAALAGQIVSGERCARAIERFLGALEASEPPIGTDVLTALDALVEAELADRRLAETLAHVASRTTGLCAEWARGATARVWLACGDARRAKRQFEALQVSALDGPDSETLPWGILSAPSPLLRVRLENALAASLCDPRMCTVYLRLLAEAELDDDQDGDRARSLLSWLSPECEGRPTSRRVTAQPRGERTRQLHWQLPPAVCLDMELNAGFEQLVSALQRLRSSAASRDVQLTARELLVSLARAALREGRVPPPHVASELELLRDVKDPEALRLFASCEALLHGRSPPLAAAARDVASGGNLWRQLEAIWATTTEDGFMGGELTSWLLGIMALAPPASEDLATAERCVVFLECLLLDPMHTTEHATNINASLAQLLRDALAGMMLKPVACLDDLVRAHRMVSRLRLAPRSAAADALMRAVSGTLAFASAWKDTRLTNRVIHVERKLREMKFPEHVDGEISLTQSAPYLMVHDARESVASFEQLGQHSKEAARERDDTACAAQKSGATLTVTVTEYVPGHVSGADFQLEMKYESNDSRITLSLSYDDADSMARAVPRLREFAARLGITPDTPLTIFLPAAAAGISWEWLLGVHHVVRSNLSGGSRWRAAGDGCGHLRRPRSDWSSVFEHHRVLVLSGDISRHRDGTYHAQWATDAIDPRVLGAGPELLFVRPRGTQRDARSRTELLQLANARIFAAELHSRGLPQVCVLPSVPVRFERALDTWLSDTFGWFNGQPLDERVAALRTQLASDFGWSSELIFEACLYRSA